MLPSLRHTLITRIGDPIDAVLISVNKKFSVETVNYGRYQVTDAQVL